MPLLAGISPMSSSAKALDSRGHSEKGISGYKSTPLPAAPIGGLSLMGPGAGWEVTYAIWEVLNRLLLYFCMTPWNKPRGACGGALSGGEDLEGTELE